MRAFHPLAGGSASGTSGNKLWLFRVSVRIVILLVFLFFIFIFIYIIFFVIVLGWIFLNHWIKKHKTIRTNEIGKFGTFAVHPLIVHLAILFFSTLTIITAATRVVPFWKTNDISCIALASSRWTHARFVIIWKHLSIHARPTQRHFGGFTMENFYTSVIAHDPRFNSVARVSDASLLDPTTRELVEGIISAAHQMGIEIMIFETYRSQNRQQELFNQGATKLRTVGVHHYGLACDIVRVVSGEPSWKGDFSFLGQLAHSSGLIWGGDWGAPNIKHSFIDSVHVQRCTVARQADLFAGRWYPDEIYNPYDDAQHLFAAATTAGKPVAKAAASTGGSSTNNQRSG
jgi:hypothetical protein